LHNSPFSLSAQRIESDTSLTDILEELSQAVPWRTIGLERDGPDHADDAGHFG
jgi:hypothetical protein